MGGTNLHIIIVFVLFYLVLHGGSSSGCLRANFFRRVGRRDFCLGCEGGSLPVLAADSYDFCGYVWLFP